MGGLRVNRYLACVVAGSLIFSSSAAVASAPVARAPVQQIDPWAALSALSGVAPAAALCGAAATAAAMQAGPGCVLPVVDAAPAVAQAGPPPPTPVPPVEPVGGGGFGIDPLLLGLGVLVVGALVYFLVIKKKKHNDSSPD